MEGLGIVLSFLSIAAGSLPLLLTVAALVDALRVGAEPWWFAVIFMFPVMGPILYFVQANRAGASGYAVATLKQARRTLQERQAQLVHWRGPGPLAEAGESLLPLGRYAEAEKHLKEALEKGAKRDEVAFPLATALESQGKHAEAAEVLEEICRKEPDHKFGQAQMALARCLDASGNRERARALLESIVDRRSSFEARVRLARIHFLDGKAEEARALLKQTRDEARAQPRFARRANARWIRAAWLMRSGRYLLPAAGKAGVRDPRLYWAAAAGVAGLAIFGSFVYAHTVQFRAAARSRARLEEARTKRAELRAGLLRLDREHPRTAAGIDDAAIDRYLAVRRDLQEDVARLRNAPHPTYLGPPAHSFPGSWIVLYGHLAELTEVADLPVEHEAENAFLARAAQLLAARSMAPAELEELTTTAEWQFLGRPEATPLGLARPDRPRWIAARKRLDALARHAGNPLVVATTDDERRVMAQLEASAAGSRDLAPETRALLERRRAELEAFGPAELEQLVLLWIGE